MSQRVIAEFEDVPVVDQVLAYLNQCSPEHARIRELEQELDILKTAGTEDAQAAIDALNWVFNECGTGEELRACGPTLEDRKQHCISYAKRMKQENERLKAEVQANDELEPTGWYLKSPSHPAQPETAKHDPAAASEGSELPMDSDQWRQDAIEAIREEIAAAAPAAESGGAEWLTKCWQSQQFGVYKPDWLLFADGKGYSKEQAESAADWLNRRSEIERELDILRVAHDADPGMQVAADRLAEEIERANRSEEQVASLESQLAQLQQKAEAWEKDHKAMEFVRRWGVDVLYRSSSGRWWAQIDDLDSPKDGIQGEDCSDPADAVLALAAQLESKEGE
jgi:hypothetical protein